MNSLRILPLVFRTCFATLSLAALAAHAAEKGGKPGPAAVTNRVAAVQATGKPAAVNLPVSVFDPNAVGVKARDPFFPTSVRLVPVPVAQPTTADTAPRPVDFTGLFVFNGKSGTTNAPLAIINGQTFAMGENGEVRTARGKVKIKCLEIREFSVIISVENQSGNIELKLKS